MTRTAFIVKLLRKSPYALWGGGEGGISASARTSLHYVRTSWPRAKYFPVRLSHLVISTYYWFQFTPVEFAKNFFYNNNDNNNNIDIDSDNDNDNGNDNDNDGNNNNNNGFCCFKR